MLSIGLGLLLIFYFAQRIYIVTSTREHTYNSNHSFKSQEQLDMPGNEVTLSRFDGMNFIFGLSGVSEEEGFDIFNNPYIEYHAFERKTSEESHGRTFYEKYELASCMTVDMDVESGMQID
jgi:hypothetical protein